jgi:hypothetical protein
MAALSASAAFVQTGPGEINTTVFPTLVDFNHLAVTQVTNAPVEVFSSGGASVNFSVPNFDPDAGQVFVGVTTNFQSGNEDSAYLVNLSGPSDLPANRVQQLSFALVGGAVSSVGIQLSRLSLETHGAITLQIFGISGLIETASITNALDNVGAPSNGFFYGFTVANSDIVEFRITGGPLKLENLRFGGFNGTGGGGDPDPDPDPDPSPVPEASTFLLCGGALGLLGLMRRRMTRA